MTEWREFRPRTTLLNSQFDGYRLSLDPLAQYALKFDDPLAVQKDVELGHDSYKLNVIKGFKSTNQLFTNPWKENSDFYFFDQTHAIQCINLSSTDSLSRLQQPIRVYQLPSATLHGSMVFLTDSLVIVSDGRSKLFILNSSQPKWKLLHEIDLDEFVTAPIRLLHGIAHENQLDALVGFIQDECQLLWLTFVMESSDEWKLTRRRVLQGKKWPDFAAIESNGQGVYVVVEQNFKFTFDSVIEVKPEEPTKQSVLEKIESSLQYVWFQTHGTVEIEIDSPETDESHQWSVTIQADHLTCSLNENVLIDATLFGQVDAKESSHVIVSDKKQQLNITLQKANGGLFWNDLFKEGRAIAGEIRMFEQPDKTNVDEDDDLKQPYNSQQLEECDQYSNENDSYLYRFDGNTHRVTHQAVITNQILFTKLTPPSLCIRHDVDGLIWQINPITSDNSIPWSHEATLNAFGYIQASKQNRKFLSTPTDNSYVVIADMCAHLYLYKQQTPISSSPGSSLRNRKTGKLVETIGKQFMISLENREDILGLVTSSERIYLLLSNQFIVIVI